MRRRRAAVVVLVLAGLAIGLVLLATDRSTLQRLAYVAFRAQLVHVRVALEDLGDRTVTLSSDGLRIAGSIYEPRGAAPGSAIVLVHGNTASGRQLGLYTLLARELAGRGHLVLTIDIRGFGDSDEPTTTATEGWDAARDISAAVTYLRSQPGGAGMPVHVVGHSMGAAYAVAAATADPRIAAVAAVSPPRRVDELILEAGAPRREFFYQRFTRLRHARGHGRGTAWMPVFLHIVSTWRLENYVGHFASPSHQPILLVDAEREAPDDLAFLRRLYRQMSAPKCYVTLPDANHYANSTEVGRLTVYDRRAVGALAETIHAWFLETPVVCAPADGPRA
jgi:pimeloyl-ACP methyl ester carboxylesterase